MRVKVWQSFLYATPHAEGVHQGLLLGLFMFNSAIDAIDTFSFSVVVNWVQ